MKKKAFMVLFTAVCIPLFLVLDVSFLQATNKEFCEEWCKSHPDYCDKCSDKAGCGAGYEPRVTFKLDFSDHWHACKTK